MTTLRDVAARAGVSIGSVSAVVNDAAPVSPALRERVERAVAELGYVPHGLARSLRLGRTNTIGLLVPDITNPHFSGLASAIEVACDRAGYTLTLCTSTDDVAKELRQLGVLRAQRVDGVILVPGGGPGHEAGAIRRLLQGPVVLVDRTLPGLEADAVLLDNAMAARLVVDHLVELGHRRIGLVSGPERLSIAAERLGGYRVALERHGMAFDARLVVDGGFQAEPAARAALALLGRRPLVSAIVAASSHTTIGVMQALRDRGLRCPEDVSIAAIDDFAWADAFAPRLTTAAQPIQALGAAAVQRLLGRIRGSLQGPPVATVLPPRLLVRDSSRARLQGG